MYTTLISAEQLQQLLEQDSLVIVDCRYDLMNPKAGNQAYNASHIPGSVFADVHDDLSGPPLTDQGRHPLPGEQALNELFSRLGIHQQTQVVVYDDSRGAFAARLWWLLKYMGHESVALLDGGWSEWTRHSLPTSNDQTPVVKTNYQGSARKQWLVLLDQVLSSEQLIDSREPVRYRGEKEPIDPRAGHIPGAINHFWQNNLNENGLFKLPSELKAQFEKLFGTTPPGEVVFYCGSGVTACHNLLAVAHAGMDPARLYAGSWSEWCMDTKRNIELG